MVRIVHTGDMHLDSPFAGLPRGVAQLRKEEQRETFLRVVEAAGAYKADILLIAGDMFDSRYVSADTVAFLKEAFARIPETAVFIAPGNHDFLAADSPYLTENFGENVHIFGDSLSSVAVGDAVVYGYGFSTRFLKEGILPATRLHEGEKAGILLLHGDVGTESDYNPIFPSLLEESGLTYAALGHIHSFSGFCRAGETTYAYCGIPEPRHFDEGEKGGFIRGEISAKEAKLEFVPLSRRQNVTYHVDITGLESIEAVRQKIRGLLSPENLYKIVLCGTISATMYIDTALLAKELSSSCLYIKVQDKTAVRTEEAEDSLLERLFAGKLKERTDAIGTKALRLGLEALRGQKR